MTDGDKEIWKARLKVTLMVLGGVVIFLVVSYFFGSALRGVVSTVNSSESSTSSTIPQAMDKIAVALKWVAVAIAMQIFRSK